MIVPIIYASTSDKTQVEKITAELDKLEIPHKEYMASAHKVPENVLEIVQSYNARHEPTCFITVVGRSNGLSGVVAGNSLYPVLACPVFSDKSDYLVNIHSSLQMPSDTPAMTVIDPVNCALAAAKILGVHDKALHERLKKRLEEVKASFQK